MELVEKVEWFCLTPGVPFRKDSNPIIHFKKYEIKTKLVCVTPILTQGELQNKNTSYINSLYINMRN